MKPLPRPLHKLLQTGSNELELQQVWRAVETRRRRQRPVPLGSWLRASLAVVAFAACTLWLFRALHSAAGPLRETTGHALNHFTGAEEPLIKLSDGSSMELSPEAELQILNNDSTTFVCALRRGRVTFEVTPGGPRNWQVEAGTVRVEVTGTRFTVERAEQETRVAVARGTVLVRGERVLDGVQMLSAGDRVAVPVVPAPRPFASRVPATGGAPGAATEAAGVASDELKLDRKPREPQPAASSSAGKSSLEFADQQRRRGDVRGAIQTLRAVVEQSNDLSQRSMAAFTMGKLQLDSRGNYAAAAAAFRECLRLSPPGSVAEDAQARLVQAEMMAGNTGLLRAAAAEYERRYPGGRRLTDVRRWAASH